MLSMERACMGWGWWCWESTGFREIVWLHYCNHAEIKQQEQHPLGSAGKLLLCTKRLRSHPSRTEKRGGRLRKVFERCTEREKERGWELNHWLGHGRQKKRGMIRKSPGWQCQIVSSGSFWGHSRGNLSWDMILQFDYVTDRGKKDLKTTHPVALRGLNFPQGQTILTDATRQEKGHALSNFLCRMRTVCEKK